MELLNATDLLTENAHAFIHCVGEFVENSAASTPIVLALSGGPDSTALLLALTMFRGGALRSRLFSFHINHNLRGLESEEDQTFSATLCERLGVSFSHARLDGNVADEASLRAARYAALADYARAVNANCVLTAHHQNDQVETMLFRLFRGTAPGGLLGMEPERELVPGVSLLRPFLHVSREAILQFLAETGVQARFDSSNTQHDYARNYIRNVVVPAVEARFSGFGERLIRYREMVQADEALLQTLSREAFQQVLIETDEDGRERWDRMKLVAQPLSLKRRILADALKRRAVEVNSERIAALLQLAEAGAGALTLSSLHAVFSSAVELIWICEERHKDIDCATVEPCTVQLPGMTLGCGFVGMLSSSLWQSDEPPTSFPPANAYEAIVDLNCVVQLQLRLRQPGDVIRPFGMDQLVSLKKYIHTHKRDAAADFEKHPTVVIAYGNEVLWIPGLGLSERLRVRQAPTHRLKFVRLATEDLTIS